MSYTSILGLMWAGMERNVAMMIASVPPLRPLAAPFLRITSQTFSYLRKGTSSQSYPMDSSSGSKNISGHREAGFNPSKKSAASMESQEQILPPRMAEYV
jgi:hypothetical protein